MQLLLGFLLADLVSFVAYRVQSLSKDGALAAVAVGTIVFGLGGWPWSILLLTFFISSSVLTRAFRNQKAGMVEKYSKGGQRDAGQVFGNGAVAVIFILLHWIFAQASWPWLGYAAALAAVNADTWATELGVFNPVPPRMITDLRKQVDKGTSGGVSLWGTAAALLGAALIGFPAALLNLQGSNWFVFISITIAGLLGSLFDSLLGATVQAMYFCPKDQKETEKHPFHTCGTPTIHMRGWEWLSNDWVNFGCGAVGALIALAGRGIIY